MAEIITTTGTQTGSSAPWSVQQPYLTGAFETAEDLSKKRLRYGPGTVAPMGQATTGALNEIIGMGQNNPYLGTATDYYQNVVGGDYLGANPYLDAMYASAAAPATRQFTEGVLPGLGAKFGMSGRSGSPGMMNAVQSASTGFGEGMGTLAANLYGQAYENERQRQQEMAMFAPSLINTQLGLAGAGLEAGQTFDEQAQRELLDRAARFRFNQEEPWKRLERYMGAISGQYGGQTTQNTTQQQPIFEPELWQQILGGATALGGSGAFGEGGWLPGLLEGAADFAGNTWDWFSGLFDRR